MLIILGFSCGFSKLREQNNVRNSEAKVTNLTIGLCNSKGSVTLAKDKNNNFHVNKVNNNPMCLPYKICEIKRDLKNNEKAYITMMISDKVNEFSYISHHYDSKEVNGFIQKIIVHVKDYRIVEFK